MPGDESVRLALTRNAPVVMFWLKFVIAIVVAAVILRIGYAMLRNLARPLPPPPPPGELRKVRLVYRCSLCGTEVRMTVANDEEPDAPRHCQEDMELVAPVDE